MEVLHLNHKSMGHFTRQREIFTIYFTGFAYLPLNNNLIAAYKIQLLEILHNILKGF